jgi:hypothetical protein
MTDRPSGIIIPDHCFCGRLTSFRDVSRFRRIGLVRNLLDRARHVCGLPPEGPFMPKLIPTDFDAPAILLGGPVDYDMYKDFRAQLDRSSKEGLVVTELSTLGGDPEVARMMGEDIRFHSENSANCRFVFLGKAAIYSAGTTFMSFSQSRTDILRAGRG